MFRLRIKQYVASWVITSILGLNIVPTMVAAQTFEEAAAAGISDGKTFGGGQSVPPYDSASQSFQIFNPDGTSVTMDINSIFQSPSSDVSSITATYDDEAGANTLGTDTQTALETEASPTGNAYRTVITTGNLVKPNIWNDPIWNLTADTLTNAELVSGFDGCIETSTLTTSETTTHIPEYHTCEKILVPLQSCTIDHNYNYKQFLTHAVGPYNYQTCGYGCLNFWVGTKGDNNYRRPSGAPYDEASQCYVHNQYFSFDVHDYTRIQQVILTQVRYEQYLQVWLNGEMIYDRPAGVFPPDTSGHCTSGDRGATPNLNFTHKFDHNGRYDFHIRVSFNAFDDGGEGWSQFRMVYDPYDAIENEALVNNCGIELDQLQTQYNESCGLTYSCTSMPTLDGNGCRSQGFLTACEDDFAEGYDALDPSINPFCREVRVTVDCPFFVGQMDCYTDAHGNEVCPYNDGSNPNSCEVLEDDPDCAFVSGEAVQGAVNESGQVLAETQVWDCGYDHTMSNVFKDESYDCGTAVRCMGTECTELNDSESLSFGEAVSALQVAQMVQWDGACQELTGTEDVTCPIFEGEHMECKKAMGGVVDCCESPDMGVSFVEYIQLFQAMGKLDDLIMGLDSSSGLQGSWKMLRDPAMSVWDSVTEPFTSVAENLTGFADTGIGATVDSAYSKLTQEALNATAEFVYEVFGEAATDLLFEAGASATAESASGAVAGGENVALSQTASSMMSAVMWAYTVYVIVILIINIIWACEEEEFELAMRKELKNCHYVGSYCADEALGVCIEKRESYCCYNTPMSRIIQEQIRLQGLFGIWGDVENPNCGGLTVEQLELVDWSLVDLSEWIALLDMAGLAPKGENMTLDKVTGSGSEFNIDGNRTNTLERSVTRQEGLLLEEVVDQGQQEGYIFIPDPVPDP